jgi:periplasmic divalent cation tolerance protein
MKPLLIQVTVGNEAEAQKIANSLVENRLAACVQIVPGIISIYRWEGKICQEGEYLLLIKSSEEKWGEMREMIKRYHSYQCPEIVTILPLEVDQNYLNWWKESISIQ